MISTGARPLRRPGRRESRGDARMGVPCAASPTTITRSAPATVLGSSGSETVRISQLRTPSVAPFSVRPPARLARTFHMRAESASSSANSSTGMTSASLSARVGRQSASASASGSGRRKYIHCTVAVAVSAWLNECTSAASSETSTRNTSLSLRCA